MNFVDNMESAVIKFGKQLFRDEKNAAIFSGIITAIAYLAILYIWGKKVPKEIFLVVLPLAAPVFEKPFLFLSYFLQARRSWMDNGQRERYWMISARAWCREIKKYSKCFVKIWRKENAWRILKADLFYHDTLSWLFMMIATTYFLPEINADINLYKILLGGEGFREIVITGLLGGVCFGLAVLGATILEVKFTDLSFCRFQRKLVSKYNFGKPEEYIEMLYVVFDKKPERENVERLQKKWRLVKEGNSEHVEYEIINHELEDFNNWRASLQIRKSTETGDSIQIAYEMPFSIKTEPTDAFRCFAVRKIKWKLCVNGFSMSEINSKLAEMKLVVGDVENFSLKYNRHYVYNPDNLSISIDDCRDEGICWIEAKIWPTGEFINVCRKLNEFVSRKLSFMPSTKRKINATKIFRLKK